MRASAFSPSTGRAPAADTARTAPATDGPHEPVGNDPAATPHVHSLLPQTPILHTHPRSDMDILEAYAEETAEDASPGTSMGGALLPASALGGHSPSAPSATPCPAIQAAGGTNACSGSILRRECANEGLRARRSRGGKARGAAEGDGPTDGLRDAAHCAPVPIPRVTSRRDSLLPGGSLVAVVAAAGAVAGFVAETTLHPFDTASHRAKVRVPHLPFAPPRSAGHPVSFLPTCGLFSSPPSFVFLPQVHPAYRYGSILGAYRLILREEGWRGLLAGVRVTALVSAPSAAIYFASYHFLKGKLLAFASSEQEKAMVYFVAGGTAEFLSSMLFIPLDVVKCRLQLGVNPDRATGGIVPRQTNYRGIVHALKEMAREEGFASLYAGWKSSLLQDCTFSALQFMFYETLQRKIRQRQGRDPTALECFFAGGAAGGLAAVLTNPLDLVTARLMSQDNRQRKYGQSIWSVLRQAGVEGPLGLWRGTVSRAMSVMPLAAIQFSIFEVMRDYFGDALEVADSDDDGRDARGRFFPRKEDR